MRWIILYLLVINGICYLLYGMDKNAAIDHRRRIPEKVLLGLPVLGGTVGAMVGMFVFRHKTKHWYFRYGLPALLVVQVVAILWICKSHLLF